MNINIIQVAISLVVGVSISAYAYKLYQKTDWQRAFRFGLWFVLPLTIANLLVVPLLSDRMVFLSQIFLDLIWFYVLFRVLKMFPAKSLVKLYLTIIGVNMAIQTLLFGVLLADMGWYFLQQDLAQMAIIGGVIG